ncbi:methyltransferase domain-containing protein, partial [Pseudomonadota bacterium]
MVEQRQRVLDKMKLGRGDRILDIGSGPGYLAQSMGKQVGSGGQVEGMDISESMCAIASNRCAAQLWVNFRVADAAKLPFDNDYFDVAVCTQVYEYVDDLGSALAELARVIKPGGRALVLDTDWGSIVWHSSNPERMQRVLKAWDEHLIDPYLPRTLGAKLIASGLNLVKVE